MSIEDFASKARPYLSWLDPKTIQPIASAGLAKGATMTVALFDGTASAKFEKMLETIPTGVNGGNLKTALTDPLKKIPGADRLSLNKKA